MTKTLDERREEEYAYYQGLYRDHGYFRRTMRWDTTNDVCALHGLPGKWLDVGCGGHHIKVPPRATLTRTDPGHDGVVDSFACHQVVEGYGEESFDVVSCFDVLEHLLPEELDEGIVTLWGAVRPGGRLIVSVGTDVGGVWNGREAHLTQEPMEWWQALMEKLLGVDAKHVATSKGTSPFFVLEKKA